MKEPAKVPSTLWAGVNLFAMSAVALKTSLALASWDDALLFVAAAAGLCHGLLLAFDHALRGQDS